LASELPIMVAAGRLARWVGACLILCFPLAARSETTWQSGLSISGSATDNLRPSVHEAKERAFFVTIAPQIRLAVERNRSVFSLDYRCAVDLYADHLDSTSYVNVLGFQSFFRIHDTLRLSIGVGGTQGKQSALLLARDASMTPLGAQLPGAVLFAGGTGFERIDWDFTRVWTSFQDLAVTVHRPIDSPDQPAGLIVANQLGIERRWINDAVAGVLQPIAFIVDHPVFGSRESQIITTMLARYRHDFGYYLSGEAALGLLAAISLEDGTNQEWGPSGRVAAYYRREEGWAELSAAHNPEVNAMVGRAFMVEEVRLQGGIPLVRSPALAVSSSGGYQYAHALLTEGASGGTHVLLADVALGWQASGYLRVAARYQFSYQSGDDPGVVPISRHVGLLSLTVYFPPEGQDRPIRVPNGRSNRADGSDGDLRDEDGEGRRRHRTQ